MSKVRKTDKESKEIEKLKYKIGNRLFALRDDEKISQFKLADKIYIEPGTICDYERGKSLIPIYNLLKYSSYYNVTTDFLINGTKPTLTDEIAFLLMDLDESTLQHIIEYIRFLYINRSVNAK